MTAAHVPRPAGRVPRPAAQGPVLPVCPKGFFMALASSPSKAHPLGWPPRFAPQMQRTREVEQSELSRINREAQVAQVALGKTGTIVGLSQRADDLIRQRVVAKRAVR